MHALKIGLKLLAATLAAVLVLAGALWFWSGTGDSLAALLTRLQRFLPADQTLEAKDVRGSLRDGGHIGWLRWQRGELSVQAQDIRVAWTLGALLNKQLRLSELTVASLTFEDHRTNTDNTPPTPPANLTLPISIDVPFKVASFSWTGSTTLQATDLSGHYIFNSYSHKIEEGQGRISSGIYQINGELQALAPMALTLQVNGQVATTVPSRPTPLTVAAAASLTGELSGPQAKLALQATLTPELPADNASRAAKAEAMQATLSAIIAPWQAQPLTQAKGQWRALDLAALWPQAPQTRLAGEANVTPAGDGWQGQVLLTNDLPGPWNQQHLPLASLRATVNFVQGQWALQALSATGAGGTVTGTGQFNAGLWQGEASLQGVNPAGIDSRVANASMSGSVQVRQTSSGIGFAARIQSDAGKPRLAKASPSNSSPAKPNQPIDHFQAIQLQSLQADGLWASPLLSLNTLHIDAQDARLVGQNLQYHTVTQAAKGQATLNLPGLDSTLDGNLSSATGQGNLTVSVTDAARATRWLSRFPAVANTLRQTSLEGAAELKTTWQGGWQAQAIGLKIDAALRAPKLDWTSRPTATSASTSTPPQSTSWHFNDLQVDLSGTLAALQLRAQGHAKTGTRQIDWQTQLSASQLDANHWQAALNQLKLSTQDSAQPGSWSLQLTQPANAPVALDWRQNNLTQTLTVSGSSAQLTGPLPGVASLSWQPARWSQQRGSAGTPTQPKALWQSQGQISRLPLAWLDALSNKSMTELGLSSDVLLAGNWDAKHTDTLHLSALLERSSGDLRLSTDASRQRALPANMQEARLNVNLDGGQLSGSLRWDSERAGKALMAFSTRLDLAQGLQWADDAPLGGSLQMQLPPVDAWSMLAPPGWRLRGTLDANATLTGTRKQPHWLGTLRAQDLAVRSVADGIDFQQGSLTARLEGQQLTIDDFTLFGAGGTAGGTVKVTGTAQWLPAGKPDAPLAQRVAISLEANAKALRLSTRSDRRITVSGRLTAQLKDTRLVLRGKLSADQALITLPSESAPTLGDDVVVRPSAAQAAQEALAKRNAPVLNPASKRPVNTISPDVQVTLDLGPDFSMRGRGLDTRLAGNLELRAIGNAAPTLTGSVRTVRGTYQAYGQRLDIEQGVLRFFGPVDNPALDILAIRPKLSQRVGVQVLGTALSPVVRLYADPELPEAEKLAWLVLGRSASGSGGEAALLQQAALALLGGNGQGPSASLTQALGLDELSFRGSSDNTASGATVTLGKRLSNDFYVAYESGLAGTMGVFTIFYDLSKRLTLRAQTGEQSAIDLIWTLRYD
ncbi:MAG: translocation/assembly module TamB domain-containing protein [Rhodoferax sp.]|uniref:translocation/assembly module TamB domain-containing protein n=1 Tax=Rhodoferax sp. TaxID=50421 RepID=UPI0026388ED1|nr:translocation/assembly module TamB domain-containing protein [Rhodoferax sp.]MDD2879571.1 translocation/assembly module TamB domain-containing protein [Rhodoferax sp.]